MTSTNLLLYVGIMLVLSLLSRGLLAPFLLVFLVVRAFGITFQDILFVFRSPGSVLGLFFNEELKRNHSLEHATLNILQEKDEKPRGISGSSNNEGFIINGVGDTEEVREAAVEAIKRMSQGEPDLVVHRGCGSTKIVLGLIGSLIALGVAIIFLRFYFVRFQVALLIIPLCVFVGILAGYILTGLFQRYLTTSRNTDDILIDSVEYKNTIGNLLRRARASVFVYTRHLKRIN